MTILQFLMTYQSKKDFSINYDNLQFTTSLEYIRANMYIDLKTSPQTLMITAKETLNYRNFMVSNHYENIFKPFPLKTFLNP